MPPSRVPQTSKCKDSGVHRNNGIDLLFEFKFSCLHPRNMGPSVLNWDSSFWCFMEYILSKIAKQTSCCIQCDLSETTRHRLWVETRERRYQDKRTSILEMMPTMMELWEQRSRRCLRWRNVDLWIPWKESLRRTLELEFCFHNRNQFRSRESSDDGTTMAMMWITLT